VEGAALALVPSCRLFYSRHKHPGVLIQLTDADIERVKAIAQGDYVAQPKTPFDLHTADPLRWVTRFLLPMERFEQLPGLMLSRGYVHLSAPFMMAFSPLA
jgi:hypothetical protein